MCEVGVARECGGQVDTAEYLQFGDGKTASDFSCCETLMTAVPATDA